MKLSRPSPLSKVIRTICLPEAEEKFTSNNCVASGWGRVGPSPSLSTALLEANIPLLNIDVCKEAYGNSVPLIDGHLCAGHTDGSSGSCVVILFYFLKLIFFSINSILIIQHELNILFLIV